MNAPGLEFTPPQLEDYLREIGLDSIEHMRTDQHFSALFVRSTGDFLAERLSFDSYSTICEKMLDVYHPYEKLLPPQWSRVLIEGAELSWCIRNDPDTAVSFLKDLVEFYNRILSTKS